MKQLVSVVIPIYNEQDGLARFYLKLNQALGRLGKYRFELIFVNDGSQDDSAEVIRRLAAKDRRVRLLQLVRNFGKEIATTAGLHYAAGEAIILIDADGQHPVSLLPKMLKKWQNGARLVIGVRRDRLPAGRLFKGMLPRLFYRLLGRSSDAAIVPGSTDFRLLDKSVKRVFSKLKERRRMTRGLIDWLGFTPEYIAFTPATRLSGKPSYSGAKRLKLALDGFVSLSLAPLYFAAWAGLVITGGSALAILLLLIEQTLLGDPWQLKVGLAGFAVLLVLLLTGLLLVSQGILAAYLAHIHTETQNRPLYIIDSANSIGLRQQSQNGADGGGTEV